jgi:hypothetical protein
VKRLLLVFVLAACGVEEVDPAGLPSIENYGDWAHFDFHGDIAGHGESWRAVFVNSAGTSFDGVGLYPIGTVIVKEVRELDERDGQPAAGGLLYRAIMRKVGRESGVDAPVDNGWIFTQLKDCTETHLDSCYASCHRQAPLDGTFFDYGQ